MAAEALRAFGEEDLVPELDGRAHLTALDQVGMRLKNGIDLLAIGDLLSVERAPARLIDHTALPLRRFADAARPAGRRGVQDRPAACEDADAADGDGGTLSPAAHHEAGAWPQGLSVPAARHRDRAAEPGVGDGPHLHPD